MLLPYHTGSYQENGETIYTHAFFDGGTGAGFPENAHIYRGLNNRCIWKVEAPWEYKIPPRDWDGKSATLGFRVPAKDTKNYNLILCYLKWLNDHGRSVPPTQKPEEPVEWSIRDDTSRCKWCRFSTNFGKRGLVPCNNLKFPKPFEIVFGASGELGPDMRMDVQDDIPVPDMHWDGRESTLGFPMPEKDSPLYNMLMC